MNNGKNRETIHMFPTIVLYICLAMTISIYCWCLVSAYANYESGQSLQVSIVMLIIFLLEMALDHFALPRAMQRLEPAIQGMSMAVWLYTANWVMFIVLVVVAIYFVLHVILTCDDMVDGIGGINKTFLLSLILLEGVYIFRLAGGCADDTYEKSIIALALIVISYALILAKRLIANLCVNVKERLQKCSVYQRWKRFVLSCHTRQARTVSPPMISMMIILYMGMVFLGMTALDEESYRQWVISDYDVRAINADALLGNPERLYQVMRNGDGSITSCGIDPQIYIYWEDFGITETPHNVNLVIENMTHIYERGQLFSFDDDVIECRNLDLVAGDNNISLEHLPDTNAYIRIDLTDYDAANFMITEIRINDYMPYVRKIKECSAFLSGLSLMAEGILVAYVVRKRCKEKRCENC